MSSNTWDIVVYKKGDFQKPTYFYLKTTGEWLDSFEGRHRVSMMLDGVCQRLGSTWWSPKVLWRDLCRKICRVWVWKLPCNQTKTWQRRWHFCLGSIVSVWISAQTGVDNEINLKSATADHGHNISVFGGISNDWFYLFVNMCDTLTHCFSSAIGAHK